MRLPPFPLKQQLLELLQHTLPPLGVIMSRNIINRATDFHIKMRVGIVFKKLIIRIFLNELFHRDTSSSFIPIALADEIFAIIVASF